MPPPRRRIPAALTRVLGNGSPVAADQTGDPDQVAVGYLVVRASGASAARSAMGGGARRDREPERIQLVMRAALPGYLPPGGTALTYPECSLRAVPGERQGTVLLTVATHRLSINFAELRPLMFRPVRLDRPLQGLFAASVAHLLVVADTLDPHGVKPYLTGLAELVLRSALRAELDRADAIATRRREAIGYIRAHLAEPALSAERIADALFISRRRLYQLFDDGDGVLGRIRTLRIERAKELLSDPVHAAKGVGEISRQCGFANAAHFSRTFRKLTGQTPREFREGQRDGTT
ncbi:helix-turn-helix transcriptional regulator [Actinophytocola sp.]|uniref:helix-turn-helix transcriptional regulator n=1 Tax=Actinophytocola sp. TaxID=1872138 RepID=UPI002D806C22|nr:helix-turn-helix transcriptional regulator [Actinophytocola sp.]HET9137768.1 helix-turn-helix transcriptional regulator [Actinophytocola sp.]